MRHPDWSQNFLSQNVRVLDRSRQAGPGLCDLELGRSWAGPGLHDVHLGRSPRRQVSLGWQLQAGQISRQVSKPQPTCAFF